MVIIVVLRYPKARGGVGIGDESGAACSSLGESSQNYIYITIETCSSYILAKFKIQI